MDDLEREKLLKSIFVLSKQLGKVPFPVIVNQSTGFSVIPIDLNDYLDKMLIDSLNKIIKAFMKASTNTRQRYQGDRINEVGRRIEDALVHEMDKFPLTVRKLSKTGYPDVEIIQENNRITYLEIKTSAVKEKSGFRYFYYTAGDKIKHNARHLLLDISVSEESTKYWKIDNWAISDLSRLHVKLKNEFNASKGDIIDTNLRIIASN